MLSQMDQKYFNSFSFLHVGVLKQDRETNTIQSCEPKATVW